MAECHVCRGNHHVVRTYSGDNGVVTQWHPCPACIGGPNAASCCEGDQPSDYDKNIKQGQDE
jgi:hypothetical protein